jgi:hypothetical protein
MSVRQQDAVEAMGLLLRDRELRQRFAKDRHAVIKELDVASDDHAYLLSLDVEQLEAQADSLIRKRRAEVVRLVPNTWSCLGKSALSSFQEYVDHSTWPQGHRRHLLDSLGFCQFLEERKRLGYLKSEHHWIGFLASDRFCSIRVVEDLMIRERAWWGIQFCFRLKGVAYRGALRLVSRGAPYADQ